MNCISPTYPVKLS